MIKYIKTNTLPDNEEDLVDFTYNILQLKDRIASLEKRAKEYIREHKPKSEKYEVIIKDGGFLLSFDDDDIYANIKEQLKTRGVVLRKLHNDGKIDLNKTKRTDSVSIKLVG